MSLYVNLTITSAKPDVHQIWLVCLCKNSPKDRIHLLMVSTGEQPLWNGVCWEVMETNELLCVGIMQHRCHLHSDLTMTKTWGQTGLKEHQDDINSQSLALQCLRNLPHKFSKIGRRATDWFQLLKTHILCNAVGAKSSIQGRGATLCAPIWIFKLLVLNVWAVVLSCLHSFLFQ